MGIILPPRVCHSANILAVTYLCRNKHLGRKKYFHYCSRVMSFIYKEIGNLSCNV